MSGELLQLSTFTLACAAGATLLAMPFGVALAWWLARGTFRGKALVETLVTLPLVMPPVATGLILLQLLAPRGPIGSLLARVGIDVVFTWRAVVVAMALMGMPLLVRTARAGFEHVDARYEHIAWTLGATPFRAFLTVTLPLATRSLVAGAVLAFARALGEFGATIMVAGSIPGRTRTLSTAIYMYAETGMDREAMVLLAVSAALSFSAVLYSNRLLETWSSTSISR
ncbi:MAG TPA: molybdate ABC transporter permease subunit [Vicinamibacterales bacterium]|nr:molybdate ABC transporter permease subunit [Vicinamibacterales bacterium]